ncbi:hypothetical protein PsorP6_017288 [Peronosclerospora sorghi]|uniref:Uncharacterized protein n=1 Tax=Peronosclerospora sorghi TaxID=230839 RepID=A0ACC0WME2_9STRA|nr:hypothetical protein PsorP6_017288 [Peronosclerospora sorghi]
MNGKILVESHPWPDTTSRTCREGPSIGDRDSMPSNGRSSPLKREALPSIVHAMGGLLFVTEAMTMRDCIGFDINLDEQASCISHDHMLRHAMMYPSVPEQHPYEESSYKVNDEHVPSRVTLTSVQNYISSISNLRVLLNIQSIGLVQYGTSYCPQENFRRTFFIVKTGAWVNFCDCFAWLNDKM